MHDCVEKASNTTAIQDRVILFVLTDLSVI